MAARRIGGQLQGGVFLLEALIAILIFSLGILGLVAMGGVAIAGQTDARVRTDAAALAGQLASQIALNVDRSNEPALAISLANFNHYPTTTDYCVFTGVPSAAPIVTTWLAGLSGSAGLPGAVDASQSIAVDTSAAGHNSVTITMCWQGPQDLRPRRFMTTVYVNL